MHLATTGRPMRKSQLSGAIDNRSSYINGTQKATLAATPSQRGGPEKAQSLLFGLSRRLRVCKLWEGE